VNVTISNTQNGIQPGKIGLQLIVMPLLVRKVIAYKATTYSVTNKNLITNARLELAWGLDMRDTTLPDIFRIYT